MSSKMSSNKAAGEASADARLSRKCFSSGTPWEPIVGYSRAIRVGPHIYVSGTTATDESGQIVGLGDVYRQTIQTIKNIERAIVALGGELEDVVRTRIYITNM